MIQSIVRSLLPVAVKVRLRSVRKSIRYDWRRLRMKLAVGRGKPLRIIVGAAETWQTGWYSTNEQWLDIARADHWERLFKGKPMLSNVVAEHVFEHLRSDQAAAALRLIAEHMQPGGRIRIAVPDGNHPDPDYIRHVGIGGIGDDAADHKQLLTAETLLEMVQAAGFRASLVEGYTRDGVLVRHSWLAEDGYIWRSRQNPSRGRFDFTDAETSLIVDGICA